MTFQKGNKIGNRFKKGVASNPMGKTGGIPRTIRAKWTSIESGLSKAGIVLDIVNQELDTPKGQENLRQSIRDLMAPGDPQKTLRFLTFVMTFAPKVKQEAVVAEFTENREALRRAISKLNTTTDCGQDVNEAGNNLESEPEKSQVIDVEPIEQK